MEDDMVKTLLLSVERKGMKELVDELQKNGYFTCPASTKYHGAFEGGLVEHCCSVYALLKEFSLSLDIDVSSDTLIICAFLHDICKVNAYIKCADGYIWNPANQQGHAVISLERIKKFIEITKEEEEIIRYHMGMYGSREFSVYGEYSLREWANAAENNKLIKFFYFCDDLSTNFMEG